MVDRNHEVRRISNATTVVKEDTSNQSVGTTRRVEIKSLQSHQHLKDTLSARQRMVKFYSVEQPLLMKAERSLLMSGF